MFPAGDQLFSVFAQALLLLIPYDSNSRSPPIVCRRSSEFAHPDILIGLTVLAYRYEGLRRKDLFFVLRNLRSALEEEAGAYKNRPSAQLFEQVGLCFT